MSSSDDGLSAVEAYIGGLLSRMSPAERVKLARTEARELRRSNAGRIAAQVDPEGAAYAPRKPRPKLRDSKGRLRKRGPMFRKLRLGKHMKATASAEQLAVGFAGRVGRIAALHHHGGRDKVERRSGAPEADYPARRLVGFNDADRARLMERLLAQLTGD